MTKSLTYIEIELDSCANTYGSAPCVAAIPTTGSKKCFNTTATCQDRENFVNAPVTLRFCMEGADFYPMDIDAIPSVVSVEHQPGKVSLGEDLGERASLNVTFRDHRDSDTGPAGDKYLADRSYDPFTQGSFFGKFRNRQKFIKGSPIRLIRGTLGQTLEGMVTRHFVVESFTGPDSSGMYQIIAKDVLKLADNDRAQAPVASNGFLLADITNVATSFTLNPSGIADEEYPTSGYLAIGGKEAVAFTRARSIDADTKLMLHLNGSDAATSTTDSSASAHTVTFFGNAQLDTAQKKFGTASLLLDGVNDYIQLSGTVTDFEFDDGDFTIEMWVRLSAIGTQYVLYDSTPAAGSGLYPKLLITSSNTVQFLAPSALISGTTALVANQWCHIALTRADGITRLFLDGVQEGDDYADTNAYINGASRPVIGTNGATVTADEFAGWIDEVSISKGVARWDRDFIPDVLEMSNTLSNTINITRAQLGTVAQAHKANDRVQLMLNYSGVDPADIIYDLLKNYANVPIEYLPLDTWKAETLTYLAKVYTANIGEPTGVKKLIGELIEQAALVVWWDDVAQLVRLQVMRRISTTAAVFDEENILEGSFSVREQPEKRISQVWTFFNQVNPLEKIDQPDNYRSAALTVDLQAESDYGSSAIKKIFSRWIPAGGLAVAQRVNDIQLARFKDPPRAFEFALFAGEAASLGGGYQVGSWALQDDEGLPALAPVQVVRLTHAADSIRMAAEEVLFGLEDIDPNARVIILDTSQNNVNIQTIHDSLYPPITTVGSITLTITVAAGVIIGSANVSTPAMDIGTFTSGLPITLNVAGRIQGAGGKGDGAGAPVGGAIHNGGTALLTTMAIDLDATGGEIWGGGGGGGYGISGFLRGGGGGAGTVGGAKGLGSTGTGSDGGDGTSEAGGAAGGGGAGAGGGPGLAGAAGTSSAGGARGNAVDGISLVTVIAAGDRRGAEIN